MISSDDSPETPDDGTGGEHPGRQQDTGDSGLKDPGFEIFIAALSVLSIVNLVLIYVIDDADLSNVLWVMNGVLSVVFIADFLYRLFTADSKRTYVVHQLGWADLLASLPLPQVKLVRLFRLLRVVRLMRTYGARSILRSLVADRAGSALLSMLLLGILVLQFGSFSMLLMEKDTDGSNITTASDALWWVVVTMSTVGYGDQFPVSTAGRILGVAVIMIGVGIFGTFTGFLANFFLSPTSGDEPAVSPSERPNDIDTTTAAQLEELRVLVARQQHALDEMVRLLERR